MFTTEIVVVAVRVGKHFFMKEHVLACSSFRLSLYTGFVAILIKNKIQRNWPKKKRKVLMRKRNQPSNELDDKKNPLHDTISFLSLPKNKNVSYFYSLFLASCGLQILQGFDNFCQILLTFIIPPLCFLFF